MSKKEITIPVMGMVRDFVVAFTEAQKTKAPEPWAGAEDKASGRRVTADVTQAKDLAEFFMSARTWAADAFQFSNPTRKNNALRHGLRIAKEFGAHAGVTIDLPKQSRGKGSTDETPIDLPTEPVYDLVPGDEIMVVRHITRYGMNQVEKYPATVQGMTKKGEYWVTSKDNGSSRACRPTEVIVVKRAGEATEPKPKKGKAAKAETPTEDKPADKPKEVKAQVTTKVTKPAPKQITPRPKAKDKVSA